ncbi:MAG: hypothetical protein Q9175_004888 [Cornicularia normoerica]
MSRENGTRSRVAAEQGVSKVVDLPAYSSTEESAGPSRLSKRDPPAQVRTYPPWWPYWDDNGTPIPTPLSANGEGHSFHEISEELLKLGYGKLAGRDAKACEIKWSDFHEKKNFIRWTAEEDAELKLFLKDDTMSWADIEEKFCYRGKNSAQNRWRKNPRNFADMKD